MIDKYIDMLKYLSDKYEEFSFYPDRKEMINTELFFIFLYINEIRPEVIFESGYWKGRSSLIILETLKRSNIKCDYYIACILKKAVVYFDEDYSNFNLLQGYGEDVIKEVAKINNGKKIVSLIDGPKFKFYKKCSSIYDDMFNNFDIKLIFQHDLDRKLDNANHKKYYDDKVDKNKYGIDMISPQFLDKHLPLMDTNKTCGIKLGIIYDRNMHIDV
jgi:hypothetical protein